MKKLCNAETELKKHVVYKKKRVYTKAVFLTLIIRKEIYTAQKDCYAKFNL